MKHYHLLSWVEQLDRISSKEQLMVAILSDFIGVNVHDATGLLSRGGYIKFVDATMSEDDVSWKDDDRLIRTESFAVIKPFTYKTKVYNLKDEWATMTYHYKDIDMDIHG